LASCPTDCKGVKGGNSVKDECGVCDGDGLSCADCSGMPNGIKVLDECGVCGGDSTSCFVAPTPPPTVTPPTLPSPTPTSTKQPRPEPRPTVKPTPICEIVDINLNKNRISKTIKTLRDNSIKYWTKAGKNGNVSLKLVETTKLYQETVKIIASMQSKITVCEGTCIDVIYNTQIRQLKRIARKLYKLSIDAQHAARLSEGNLEAGVTGVKKLHRNTVKEINECPKESTVCK
jgi:hypothetical protein